MGKLLRIGTLFFILFLSSGCSIGKQIVGEYYLEGKKFESGEKYFQKRIAENKNDASSHYYYGRFLLAQNQNKKALTYFKKAILLNDRNSSYFSWLGVAYSKIKQPQKEKKAYEKALSLDKNNLQALIYLAHNLYESKEYKQALKMYEKVLKLHPSNKYALYNRAMSLKNLKRVPEEKSAWRVYLEYYPAGRMAFNAVKYLNAYGIFDYENHIIGSQRVILKEIAFEPFTLKITFESSKSLDVLGQILSEKQDIKLHIVAYQQNNLELAKYKAKAVKEYLVRKYPKVSTNRLILSWFDKQKIIKSGNKIYLQGQNIDFITVLNRK